MRQPNLPAFSPPALPDVQPGDIFALGRHRMMCGDATKKEDVARLFDGRKPTLVVTSPPYAKQRDYDRPIACWDSMMMGALDGPAFAENAQLLINLGVVHSKNEWSPYWWQFVQNMRVARWRFYAMYIWDKQMSFPGKRHGRLLPSHEFILHLNRKSVAANAWRPNKWHNCGSKVGPMATGLKEKNGKPTFRKPKPIRSHSEPLSVISMPAVKSIHEATGHPAQMPVSLASFLLRSWKKEKCIAYDPFAGSGTTLFAAERENADGVAMEIAPAYVQIALERWRKVHPDQRIERLNR